MHVLTNAEKLIPLRDAASLAESRRLAGMRMVTGTTSPSTRYERISVSPASCSIKSEYVIASHAFKPQYKCINYTPAWEQRKFGELYRPVSEKNDLSFGRDKAISVANMYFNPAVYVTEDSYLATYNVMRLGDIAFEGNRSKRFAHGRFVENTIGDGIVSHVFKVFRHVGDNYDLSYWKHAINNEKLMKDVLTRSTKASTMMHELVTADFLEELTLVPSLNEQRAIGAAIDSIDNLITLHQRKYDKLVVFKKSMLEKMFPKDGESVPEIRFAGFTDPWEQRKLGEIASFSKGSGYSKADIRESGIPLFLYGRMYTQYETRVDSVDTFAAPRPGTLYSKGTEIVVPASGESAEDIARASAITREGIALGGDLNVVYPQRMVTPLFLAYGLSHGSSQKLLAQKAQGKTVVHIHASDLKGLGIAFPDVTEQQAIGTFFSSLDDLITLHQRKLELLRNIKKSLLDKMFV